MIKLLPLTLVAIATVTAGCASGPSAHQLAAADYGPMPENAQEMIKAYVDARMRDPSDAKYDFYRPLTKSWYGYGNAGQFGWATCVGINAKNAYGGFTGSLPSYFFIKDGVILQAIHSASDGEAKVRELCAAI